MSVDLRKARIRALGLLLGGASCQAQANFDDPPELWHGSTEADPEGSSSGDAAPDECPEVEIVDHGDHEGTRHIAIGGCEEHRWWLTHVSDDTQIDVYGAVGHELHTELSWPVSEVLELCEAPVDQRVGASSTLEGVSAGELQLRIRNPLPSPSSYEIVRRCGADGCPAPLLRFPILMVPGWGPLGRLSEDSRAWAREQTTPVELAELPQFMPPRGRALLLQDEVERIRQEHCARRVNLLAFDQGGLDGRVLISSIGRYDVVESLLTAGTPHGGTPLAGEGTAADVLELLGIDPIADVLESWSELSPSSVAELDSANPDHPMVDYLSYVGSTDECRTIWRWLPSTPAIDNDCITPASSAAWGTVVEGLPSLNHFELLGHDPCPLDLPKALPLPEECTVATHARHLELYAELIRVLRDRGH